MQPEIHFQLLKLIEQHPNWTQRQLAQALGVSLGKVNYCLKALKEKGWVRWGNFSQNPNKLSYVLLLTPQGIAQKLSLTAHFLRRKEAEYDQLQAEIRALREELRTQRPTPAANRIVKNEREPAQLES
jgi:EPS-associated MarR family transcriptional regulator